MEKIPISEYAASRKQRGLPGGTVQGVTKAAQAGRITMIDGMVNPETADFEWEKNTRRRIDLHGAPPAQVSPVPADAVPPPKAEPSPWADAKARTELAVAGLKELELEQRKGTLIDRAGYERGAQKTFRTLRDTLVDLLPAKLAIELAALTDPWEVERLLRNAIRAELLAVAGEFRAEAEAPSP